MEANFCLFHWVHNVLFLRASNFRAEVEPSNFCYFFSSLFCVMRLFVSLEKFSKCSSGYVLNYLHKLQLKANVARKTIMLCFVM